jgi:hypothetical protein
VDQELEEKLEAEGDMTAEGEIVADVTDENSKNESHDARESVTDVCAELGEFCPGITEDAADSICNLSRYRELRALGLNSEEAYRATARQRTHDGRAHLSGAVGNAAPPRRGGISEQELRSARELLGGISDAEIRRLYKRVNV